LIMAGVALAASQIIIGEASVLYTFYPPLAASGWFYVGLLLVVLGIWTAALGVFINVFVWRKQNRGQHVPLLSYFATGVFILLFGSFGHTLVNVWYLTAVSAWYVAMPKIIGGRQFSDTLARVVVFMLVILNIPGGFHHQIVDPGFSEGLKYMHVFMSLAISIPSLMTAFAMFAIMERAGRKKGGKGLFGW